MESDEKQDADCCSEEGCDLNGALDNFREIKRQRTQKLQQEQLVAPTQPEPAPAADKSKKKLQDEAEEVLNTQITKFKAGTCELPRTRRGK